MNSYPYLDAKTHPPFTGDLGDITTTPHAYRIIDVSSSPLVPARELRSKLNTMHMAGELDGGLPLVKDGVLVGIIPGPDLEFGLDRLGDEEEEGLCFMNTLSRSSVHYARRTSDDTEQGLHQAREGAGSNFTSAQQQEHLDFSPYIDPSPVALEISSPLELVYECFSKLGLRYICVVRTGKFVGLVHKKAFVRYVKELEEKERKRQ